MALTLVQICERFWALATGVSRFIFRGKHRRLAPYRARTHHPGEQYCGRVDDFGAVPESMRGSGFLNGDLFYLKALVYF